MKVKKIALLDEAGENVKEGESKKKRETGGRGHIKFDERTHLIADLFHDYFVEYSSYVILDRAIPKIEDGLKPVQRRILHSLKEMDDGRYNKVANVVGHAMRYHPHGDASIKDALVNIGQKHLLIDTQGNWGNTLTGDAAAAPRYIEARLTKFAHEVVFNKDLTQWQPSYDSRGQEPVALPIKIPLLLALGAEGIAVGLSTKILPHNMKELLQASIEILKGKKPVITPDFPTGGTVDVTDYDDGRRGGRIKVRAKIEIVNPRLLRISEIPFGTTTVSLIESIVSASEKGKIKIKKVEDNTAKDVDIQIHLPTSDETEKTIKALYAFTRCEESIAPVPCVIDAGRPVFLSVSELLRRSTERTKELLGLELRHKEATLKEKMLFSSLEKIFIEEKIYRSIENCETWEGVIQTIDSKLKPYKKLFYREVNDEDITQLTEIKIKRISKFDVKKADEILKKHTEELGVTQKHLSDLTKYTIDYFAGLISTYGRAWVRKTKTQSFNALNKTDLAVANLKLYMNAKEGFVGTGLKKEEFISDCSDIDEIICFTKDGKFTVVKASDKTFVGKNIIHCAVYRRGDDDTVYNMVYSDGKDGFAMVKRFTCPAITRDKAYDMTKGTPDSSLLFFSVSRREESPGEIHVTHKPAPRIKKDFGFDLGEVLVKSRDSQGNILSRHKVAKVTKSKR